VNFPTLPPTGAIACSLGLGGDFDLADVLAFNPGYRVYFQQRANLLIVLLCGGDKGSQGRDIAIAKEWNAQDE